MRIGLFTNNYPPMLGGVATAVLTLRATLESLGHEAWIVAPATTGPDDADPRVVRVPALPAPTYPDFSLPLPLTPSGRRRLEALRLDVLHAQHPFLLGGTAWRLARSLGRPLAFTYHTRYDQYAHYVPLPQALVARLALRWSTRFANRSDLVIAPSDAMAARLRSQGVQAPMEVLPTGIDVTRFRPGDRAQARRATGLPPGGPLLLYVGRLDREKNLEFLFDAFERVAARAPSARFALVGRGTRAEALRGRAARSPFAGRIAFAGGVPPERVVTYYQAADVFLFASTTETQGLAVLEAMATGLPPVAVRATGVEEAVVDGVSGLLIPEAPDAMAEAVLQLLRDDGLTGKLRAGARERAARFSADLLGRRLVGLYRAMLARTA